MNDLTEIHRERLTTLALKMESIGTSKEFDLEGKHIHFDMETFFKQINCGTSGCAAYVASMMPQFKAEGFGLKMSDLNIGTPVYIDTEDGRDYLGFSACATFFGTAEPFDPRSVYYLYHIKITPADVAVVIRRILKEDNDVSRN